MEDIYKQASDEEIKEIYEDIEAKLQGLGAQIKRVS